MDGIGSELCWWDLRHRSWFDDWVCGILLLAGRGWAELGRGEEGALRDEKLSAVRSTGQWRERNSNYNNLGEWISFLLTAFEAEKNTVQVHQLVGRSLKTKILIHQS